MGGRLPTTASWILPPINQRQTKRPKDVYRDLYDVPPRPRCRYRRLPPGIRNSRSTAGVTSGGEGIDFRARAGRRRRREEKLASENVPRSFVRDSRNKSRVRDHAVCLGYTSQKPAATVTDGIDTFWDFAGRQRNNAGGKRVGDGEIARGCFGQSWRACGTD